MNNDGEYLIELIKGEMKEMHIENLDDIYEYAFSHFNAYDKKKLARAIVNEAGLLLILLMMKERTFNDNLRTDCESKRGDSDDAD